MSKGGGADTGKKGERKSERMVAMDKLFGPSKRGRSTDIKVGRRELFKSTAGKNIPVIKKGAMMTAGGESAMGRIQKARMMNKGGGADLGKDPTKPVNPFRKKAMADRALRAAKATRIGKIAAGVAGVGLAAKAFLNKKLDESRAKKKVDKKKMGGLKAELNNPAKGYMAGGMADYYKDLM